MSNVSSIDTSLETTSRQLMFLVKNKGNSFDESLLKVKAHGDTSTTDAADLLRSMADIDAALKLPPKSPFRVLADMVRASPNSQQEVTALVPRFIQQQRVYRQQVLAYILSLKNTVAYCAALVLIGIFVSSIYRSKVLPQYVDTFAKQNTELPAFTVFMHDIGLNIVFVLLVLAGIFVLTLFWSIKSIVNSANQFTPAKSWLANTVLVRQITQAVNDYLLTCYAYILAASQSSSEAVLNQAMSYIDKANPQRSAKLVSQQRQELLQLSQRLDTLELELEHQLDQSSEYLGRQLVRFRTGINIGFQVTIFVLIGAMIIAFYWPIFVIGNVF